VFPEAAFQTGLSFKFIESERERERERERKREREREESSDAGECASRDPIIFHRSVTLSERISD
jgi:hypothetical protein